MTKLSELKKNDVMLVRENTDEKTIMLDSKELPTDIHLIDYTVEGETKTDAVRAFKMSDVFDAYYDLGIKSVTAIKTGYGSIRPNLWKAPKSEDD
mgnify:FL=1